MIETDWFSRIFCFRVWPGEWAPGCSISFRREQTLVQRRRTARAPWGRGRRLPSGSPPPTLFSSPSTSTSSQSSPSPTSASLSPSRRFIHELLPPRHRPHLRAGHDLHFPLVLLLRHHLLLLAVCQGVAPALLPCAPCCLHPMAGASTLWEARWTREATLDHVCRNQTTAEKLVELGLRRGWAATKKWWVVKSRLFFPSFLSAPWSFNPPKPWLQGRVYRNCLKTRKSASVFLPRRCLQ